MVPRRAAHGSIPDRYGSLAHALPVLPVVSKLVGAWLGYRATRPASRVMWRERVRAGRDAPFNTRKSLVIPGKMSYDQTTFLCGDKLRYGADTEVYTPGPVR